MNSSTRVQIFLLCYNRVQYVDEAIRSLVNQTHRECELIISDNSTNEDVFIHISKGYPKVEIRRRRPSLDAYEHLNLVSSEATTPYFMIFHDDDILLPNAIETLSTVLDASPEIVAACPNAYFLHGSSVTNQKFNPTLSCDLRLSSRQIAARYLDHSRGINPFPGYLYRRVQVQKIVFDRTEADLYSDLTFIAKISLRGQIWWGSEALMLYRKHTGNASAVLSLTSARKALAFLESKSLIARSHPLAIQFKAWSHLLYIRNRYRQNLKVRRHHLECVLKYFLAHPLSLVRKCLQKMAGSVRDLLSTEDLKKLHEEAVR